MLDTIIVIAIVAVAAYFVGRRFLRPLANKQSSCGCSGCGQSGTCGGSILDAPEKSGCCGSK